jgi:hypothetical protein
LVGILVGATIYGAVGYAMDGRVDLKMAFTLGTIGGGAGGFFSWKKPIA